MTNMVLAKILSVLIVYAVLVEAGILLIRWLKQSGVKRWARVCIVLLVQWIAAAGVTTVAQQVQMRAGNPWSSEHTEFAIRPAMDPLPVPSKPEISDRYVGPLLVERVTRERGIPELGGGDRVTTGIWGGVSAIAFGATTITILAGGVTWGVSWWIGRRVARRRRVEFEITQ